MSLDKAVATGIMVTIRFIENLAMAWAGLELHGVLRAVLWTLVVLYVASVLTTLIVHGAREASK